MSLRHTPNIPGVAVVPTANDGIEGVDESGGSVDDPSKSKNPTTFGVVIDTSIWCVRTAHGIFWYTMGYGRRIVRKKAAMVMNGVGFACSVGVELLLTSRTEYKNKWLPLVEELKLFLQTSGIADELSRGFSNYRFLSNVVILGRIQDTLWEQRGAIGKFPCVDRRRMASLEGGGGDTDGNLSQEQRTSIIKEGRRFMNYTTAAYGITMIDAAEIDVHGSIQTSKTGGSSPAINTGTDVLNSFNSTLRRETQKFHLNSSSSGDDNNKDFFLGRISDHIGIPKQDINIMNLLKDQVEALRFFIAVDHGNKAVVLSIRGTHTLKELLVDIAGFARPFCGGDAHSEIANSAEKIWDEAKDTIKNLLNENPEYELILTGHSLGAGAASLLNILLHENNREKVDGRAIRCFAYASPPVFAGEVAKQATEACINYIHDADVVPFLSVDSIRRLFAALHALEESNVSVWIRTLILWGSTEVISPLTLLRVEKALHDPLPAKDGAPELLIPAHTNVWMRSIARDLPRDLDAKDLADFNHSLPSNFVLVDSSKLARMGLDLDPLMITSHFPNGYENVLHNLR